MNNISEGWTTLEKAKSDNLFGDDSYDEWNYPRSYLSSDGNVVGISYNKIWVMDKEKIIELVKLVKYHLQKVE